MAIDLYSSDNSGAGTTTSPRISFSYDLSQSDTVPVEQLLRSFSSSSVDFNFCINHDNNNDHQHSTSMADELFYDGKILPTQIIKPKTDKHKHKRSPTKLEHDRPPVPAPLEEDVQELKQNNNNNNNKSSFWGFKRSSSCGSGYARSLCPITLLSRSHSTGSSTSSKRSSSSSSSSSSTKELVNSKRGFQKAVSQKPPLRKSGYGHGNGNGNGNGIRVNPVLNLGFGSFFSTSNKNKNKK